MAVVLGQGAGDEKFSSNINAPRLGCISGVGLGTELGAKVLVAVEGNQSVVGDGSIVWVGVGVEAISIGAGAQALSIRMVKKRNAMR